MRNILKAIAAVFLATGIASSCTIENIDNGNLDGFWHFEQIDTLATGGVCDLSGKTLFWAFQARLMHTQGDTTNYYFRFSREGSMLVVYSPYADHGHEDKENGGDIPVSDPAILQIYGIQSLADTFFVEKLTSKKMTLSTTQHRLHFTKF